MAALGRTGLSTRDVHRGVHALSPEVAMRLINRFDPIPVDEVATADGKAASLLNLPREALRPTRGGVLEVEHRFGWR